MSPFSRRFRIQVQRAKMKAALSLTLVLFLMTSALPLTAQVRIDSTAGPISRAVTREAVRLAAEPALVDARRRAGEATNADSPLVRTLATGTEIMVTVKGSPPDQPAHSADDIAWSRVQRLSAGEEIRVVDVDDASQGAFRTADGVSITLVVAGHDQKTARANVSQVSVVRDKDRWQHVVTGLVIGGVTGGIAVGLHCRGESSSCNEVAPAYVVPGVGIGAAIGALLPPRKHWQEIYVRSGK
jgi:hypothetical protein